MYTNMTIMKRTLKVRNSYYSKIKYLTKKTHFRMNCVHAIFVKLGSTDEEKQLELENNLLLVNTISVV